MPLPLYQIDAFADRPFAGNPAAVVLLDGPRGEAWMQRVAAEMNLSETAFVGRPTEGGARPLRWFTPAAEVELCGHATLASAHVLWESGRAAPQTPIRFETRVHGELLCTSRDGWIAMDFPADPPRPAARPEGLECALGQRLLGVARGCCDYLCELGSAEAVQALRPDLGLLYRHEARGFIVTAATPDGPHDFVSRFFAPRLRIDEDPVTGSAHAVLGPYWAERLGRQELVGRQVSARGGVVRVKVDGARVVLAGQAVTVVDGSLLA